MLNPIRWLAKRRQSQRTLESFRQYLTEECKLDVSGLTDAGLVRLYAEGIDRLSKGTIVTTINAEEAAKLISLAAKQMTEKGTKE